VRRLLAPIALLALLAPLPAYAGGPALVPSTSAVVHAVPALKGARRETDEQLGWSVPGKHCEDSTWLGTAQKGQVAEYALPMAPGSLSPVEATVVVQRFATADEAAQVLAGLRTYVKQCRGRHTHGDDVTTLAAYATAPAVGQKAIAYRSLLVRHGYGSTERLRSEWVVAQQGRTLVAAASSRRGGKPTAAEAQALARLALR
jgi:hypothetical protein